MDSTVKRITEALSQAMQAENEGHHFYLMAAASTQDAKGKKVFQQLAEEEMNHFNFLKGQYKSFLKTGKADKSIKLGSKMALTGNHPIFSEELKGRIGSAHNEMTVLSIGIQLELNAVKFYEEEAKAAAEDQEAKTFFMELADWEKEHLSGLQSQSITLKEDYWTQGGFSPF